VHFFWRENLALLGVAFAAIRDGSSRVPSAAYKICSAITKAAK